MIEIASLALEPAPAGHPFTFDEDNPALVAILRHLRRGNCCQVLGPRHFLKSRLVQDAATRLADEDAHYVVYLDLANVDTGDNRRFFASLDARLRAALPPRLVPADLETCQNATDLQLALGRLTENSDRNLLVLVDHLEIAPPNLVALFLNALRVAYVDADTGSRLQSVVCGSHSLNQVALRNADRYDFIAQAVIVGDLSRGESHRLLDYYLSGRGLMIGQSAADTILDHIGGDPLLVAEAADLCIQRIADSFRWIANDGDAAAVIESFHGGHHAGAEERLRHIENNLYLLSTTRQLLDQRESRVVTPDGQETRLLLELSGVMTPENGGYRLKSRAWEELLRQRLNDGRVGRLYARAGDWKRAIDYLGRAAVSSLTGEHDYRLDLFAAIINAIHVSQDESRAFDCLNSGLQAAFPRRELLVYALDRRERALALVTSLPNQSPHGDVRISLGQGERPEVRACYEKAEFSIETVDGATRLLYPLRAADGVGDPLGLVSAAEGRASIHGLHHWEERELLLDLLHHTARALQAKRQYLDLLNNTNLLAEKTRTLDQIRTQLHDPELSEEIIWRIMLEAITHGHGLGFNRAVLFVPDDAGGVVVRQAVGYGSRAATEKDWQNNPFTHDALDEWRDGLVTRPPKPPTDDSLVVALKDTVVSLLATGDNLLMRCLRDQEPIYGPADDSPPMPGEFAQHIHPAARFVLVPLRGGPQPLGVIYADCKFSGDLIPGERFVLLQNFAQQIALIVKHDRTLTTERRLRFLEESERRQIDQDLEDLKALQRALRDNLDTSGHGPLPGVIRAELSKVRHQSGAERAWLVRVRPRDRWEIAFSSSKKRYSSREVAHPPPDFDCQQTEGMKPRQLSAAAVRQTGLANYLRGDPGALLITPVEVNNNCQGILYLELKPNPAGENHEKIAERAANRLGVVIEQVQNVRVLQRLVDISLRLTDNEPLECTLQKIVDEAMEVLRGVSVVTLYANNAQNNIVLYAHKGVRYPRQLKTHPPYDSTVVEEIVNADGPIFAPDVNQTLFRKSKFVRREQIRSVAAFPLITEGKRLGCMMFSYRRPHVFPATEQSTLSLFAQLAAAESLYDSKDRELENKRHWERFNLRAAIIGQFFHKLSDGLSGMGDLVAEADDAIRAGHDTTAVARLDQLRARVDKLERLRTTVQERLSLLKKVGRDVNLELQRVDDLVMNIVHRLEIEAPPQVRVLIREDLPPIRCYVDPWRIGEIVEHLMINAWEAIPRNGQGLIEVALYPYENYCRLEIRDNGQGITDEDRPHIFEEGFSTKDRSGRRGQGLFICKYFAELQNGRLHDGPSRKGEGSTFYLDLPIPDDSDSEREMPPPEAQETGGLDDNSPFLMRQL